MSKQLRTLLFAGIGIVALGAILAVLLLLPNRTGEGDTSSTASSDPSISLVDKSKDAQGEAVEKPVKKVTVKISPDEEKKDLTLIWEKDTAYLFRKGNSEGSLQK